MGKAAMVTAKKQQLVNVKRTNTIAREVADNLTSKVKPAGEKVKMPNRPNYLLRLL